MEALPVDFDTLKKIIGEKEITISVLSMQIKQLEDKINILEKINAKSNNTEKV